MRVLLVEFHDLATAQACYDDPAYAVARANFEKLMTTVNQEIGAGMEAGATSGIITL